MPGGQIWIIGEYLCCSEESEILGPTLVEPKCKCDGKVRTRPRHALRMEASDLRLVGFPDLMPVVRQRTVDCSNHSFIDGWSTCGFIHLEAGPILHSCRITVEHGG
jgi:hypothetical protein